MRQAVLDHIPSDLGLSGRLWTRGQIGRLIFKLHGVRFTEPGVGKYLRRWGLTFQRPDERAVEQDPEAVCVWREETWPATRARAKAENAEVLFGDQVGIRSDQVTGRTWGAKAPSPSSAGPGTRPNSPPKPEGSSTADKRQPYIVRGYFGGPRPLRPGREPHEFLINRCGWVAAQTGEGIPEGQAVDMLSDSSSWRCVPEEGT